ncbi:hypothetical protein GOP47_0021698 [Adiantum capillus-veneris]|uniref:WD repeat domain 6 n=1 Tax=Adiantum capillus-veneris TaxID=13818 RepID=A0A9D4UA28_ADICA|nr:hypothetical protein GOP47_0021698 [Adiantum capillus-veneris]
MEPLGRIHTGPYKGDISALRLLTAPGQQRYPFLLAGTGPQILLFDTGSFELLLSQNVFEGVRVHGIEVRDQSLGQWVPWQTSGVLTTLAVHGERTVKLYNLILEDGLSDWQHSSCPVILSLSKTLPRCNHWVLDVRFLKELCYRGGVGSEQLLAVGTTDNSVSVWSMRNCYFLLHVKCAERCLLYSLRFWGDDMKNLLIAAGTIFNEIVIWDLGFQLSSGKSEDGVSEISDSFKESTYVVSPKGRLKGHEGSIFQISWSQDGKRLASVSDDRSVMVWNIQKEPCDVPLVSTSIQTDGFQLVSRMYGHTARIWDCHLDSKFLITVSEDCTYRIWTIDGKPLIKKAAHLGRGIWRCAFDSANAVLFTAGADSSIKAHLLGNWLSGTDEVEKGEDTVPKPSPSLEVFCLGSQEADSYSKRVEQLDSKSEYIRCLSLVGPTCVYVATNQGVLRCAHFKKGGEETWFELFRNFNPEPIICLDTLQIQKKLQMNDSLDASEDWIAMGDSKGYVTVLCGSWIDDCFHQNLVLSWPAEGERKLLGVFWSHQSGFSSVFTADTCGALSMWSLRHNVVRKLEGKFTFNGVQHAPISADSPIKFESSLAVRYQSSFKARIVCLDTCPEEEFLVCGDQRGNLTVFNLSMVLLPQNMQSSPLASFKGAHGISAVASVRVIGKRNEEQIKICSTGRDGCICTFALEKSGARLFCLRVEKLSAVTLVESCALCNGITSGASMRTIVAGFLAEDFLIYDQQNDCEIARVSCGGWRRPHSYLIGVFPEIQHCLVFVKDGMIHVLRKWFEVPKVSSPLLSLPMANRRVLLSSLFLQPQFHGREVHSVKFITNALVSEDHKFSTSWITTGGEDGVVRILRFNEDTIEHFDVSEVLGEHVGGSAVRAVTLVTGSSLCNGHCPLQDGKVMAEPSCILISVGAKEVLTCWLLEWETGLDRRGQSTQIMSSRWLSTKRCVRNRNSKKITDLDVTTLVQGGGTERHNALALETGGEDDLRYLAVTSFSILCPQTRLQTYFATTASSNATVLLHAFQISAGEWVELSFLNYHKAPVLTLQHLVIPHCGGEELDKFMVFSGATDGSIAIWDVTDTVLEFCHKQLGQGNQRMFRPPSGRGSQGGRRWKLSRHHDIDQKQVSSGEHSTKTDISKHCEEVSNNVDCHSHVETMQAADQAFIYPLVLKPELVLPCAHQSGVNSLSVSTLKDEEHMQQNDRLWVVVSGGDDQALHVAIFKTMETDCISTNTRANTVGVSEMSIVSAHSSAIKGVWTDGFFVFTTGLDQRLRVWKLEVSKQSSSLVECCQTVMNVPEPAAIHAERLLGRNYRVAVVGRGLQIFKKLAACEESMKSGLALSFSHVFCCPYFLGLG